MAKQNFWAEIPALTVFQRVPVPNAEQFPPFHANRHTHWSHCFRQEMGGTLPNRCSESGVVQGCGEEYENPDLSEKQKSRGPGPWPVLTRCPPSSHSESARAPAQLPLRPMYACRSDKWSPRRSLCSVGSSWHLALLVLVKPVTSVCAVLGRDPSCEGHCPRVLCV